ncbi:MAG: hypothetical protein WC455_24020 [Dehalococcoidia bacterium]
MIVLCHKCEQPMHVNDATLAMNLPGITDGPQYWCSSCIKADGNYADIINMIDNFIVPPVELPDEVCELIRKHGMDFWD